MNFQILANGGQTPTMEVVDVTLTQTGGWGAANINDKITVTPKVIGTSLIKNTDVIIVTTELKTGYREAEVYLKNSTGVNRTFGVQGMALTNKLQNINGNEKAHFDLLPAMESDITTLPAVVAGTTNTIGQYNNALYLARTDGTLVKLTVDNNNIVTANLL